MELIKRGTVGTEDRPNHVIHIHGNVVGHHILIESGDNPAVEFDITDDELIKGLRQFKVKGKSKRLTKKCLAKIRTFLYSHTVL
jgi:hypothetical protein